MKKNLKYYIAIFTTAAVILTGCSTSQGSNTNTSDTTTTTTTESDATDNSAITTASTTSQVVVDTEFTANDLEVGYDESTAAQITLNGSDISISGEGATAKDGVLTISKEGTYVLSGTLDDGQIVVDVEDTEKVQIVLNGVDITNKDNAAIYIKSADKVFITLEEGTVNTLTDGAEYVQADDNNVDGVIFSKADLTINGTGTLDINGNYKHGIATKDDLVITGGIININAVKDALNGKDAVKIKDGTLTLAAETGNGIQSKNDEDETKGYVYIVGGTVTITKSQEGIEGTVIQIDGGTIDITSKDDGLNAASSYSDSTGTTSQDSGSATTGTTGMTGTVASSTNATTAQTTNLTTAATNNEVTDSTGTETDNNLINVTASDSSSGNTVDETSSATTDQTKGGPDGGDFSDGGNFSDGAGKGDFGGGGGAMENNPDCLISISGGTVTVNASGDGIDSNGSVNISGGTIYVSGPTDNGNAALDYNGTANITGGTTVIAGSTGMAQGFSDTSTQYSILYNLTAVSEAGTEVTLTDKDGKVIVSFTPDKQYQSLVISSPELAKDRTYTLTSGDQTADITLSSMVTSNATNQGMGGQGGPGGQGGMGGGFGNRGGQRPGQNDMDQSTEDNDNSTES